MVEIFDLESCNSRLPTAAYKQKTFEFINAFRDGTKLSFGTPDVDFVLGRDILHGHQSVLSPASQVFKQLFEAMDSPGNVPEDFDSSGILRIDKSTKKPRKIFVDSPLTVFEPIFSYCYSGKFVVLVDLVPPVYLLAKYLKIYELQVALAVHLSTNVTVGTIGELCRMIPLGQLTKPEPLGNTIETTVAQSERRLASSICKFLTTKADSVACSLTGQLSARLIVNLTTEFLNGASAEVNHSKMNEFSSHSDSVAFAVLKWAHQRLLSGERLARVGSEENVQPDDEESDGGGGSSTLGAGSTHGSNSLSGITRSSLLPTFRLVSQLNILSSVDQQQLRRHNSGQLSSDEEDEVHMDSDSRDSPLHVPTQDVRITVDLSELDCQSEDDTNSVSMKLNDLESDAVAECDSKFHLLTYCHSDGLPELESCLLARTSLGVGSTSIWLGKLMGHLVSLSIKRCRPEGQTNSASNGLCSLRSAPSRSDSEEANTSDEELLRKQHQSASLLIPGSVHPVEAHADEEVSVTMTASSAFHLAKAVAVVGHSSINMIEEYPYGLRLSTGTPTYDVCLDEQASSRCHILESRAGAGAGVLSVEANNYLVLVGGYTRKGCLDKVELFRQSSSGGLSSSVAGPRLGKQRGRVGVAVTSNDPDRTHFDVLYACGGSTGSMDLNSVERLTSSALNSWLSAHVSLEDLDDLFPVRSPHPSGGSCGNGVSGSNGSSSVWKSVAHMKQPRSSPTAVGLCGLQTGALVSDSRGALMVAGGLADAEALFTAEAYIPERNQWVALPNMCEARSEASSAVFSSYGLVVVAGGNANASRLDRSEALIEALDPRCPKWFYLPSPHPEARSQIRGAALVPSPTAVDSLLLIGGFNGREALSTVWIFDAPAWSWVPGPPLRVSRANHCAVTWPDRSSTIVLGGFNPSASKTGFLSSIELILSSHPA